MSHPSCKLEMREPHTVSTAGTARETDIAANTYSAPNFSVTPIANRTGACR